MIAKKPNRLNRTAEVSVSTRLTLANHTQTRSTKAGDAYDTVDELSPAEE